MRHMTKRLVDNQGKEHFFISDEKKLPGKDEKPEDDNKTEE